MAGAQDLPIAVLVTQYSFPVASPAEIRGLFYLTGCVPEGIPARAQYVGDLFAGKCCQVVIRGTSDQVEELIRLATISSGWALENEASVDEGIALSKRMQLPIGLDSVERPTGRGLPLEGEVSFAEDEAEISRRLELLRDELELTLAADWQPRSRWLDCSADAV
jgi:hypothetical protein